MAHLAQGMTSRTGFRPETEGSDMRRSEPLKILAVDDDAIALDLLSEALAGCGFENVTTTMNAANALELLNSSSDRFDVLLYDIQMPWMDGIELTRETRKLPKYANTPILMVTAMAEKSFVDGAFTAGATDYLTKPFDPLEVGVRVGLAADLVSEQRNFEESTDVIELLVKELDKVTRHKLDAPIELGRVESLLTYPAFENYLFEMTRGVFFLTSIFAIKIKDIETLHQKAPPLEFKQLLTRTADRILGPLRDYSPFLSYRGNGVFVGVMERKGTQALRQIGDELIVDIASEDDGLPPELPKEMTLIFGDPVNAKMLARPGSMRNLHSAIQNAEGKLAAKTAQKDPVLVTSEKINETDRLNELRREQELRDEFEQLLHQALETQEDIQKLQRSPKRFPDIVDPDPAASKRWRKPV